MSSNSNLRLVWIAVALAMATFALYLPTVHFAWLNVGDDAYVTDNAHVFSGVTLENVKWAFTHTHEGNWHPVTWISHMLDCSLWGVEAGPAHLTNAALHALDTALLFLLLFWMTGATWHSALVAALFGWHPLHVESVAWVAARKDSLGALLWILTTLAYALHARGPSFPRLALVTLLFALGVTTNPILAALPFTLLLLDVWPLRRLQPDSSARLKESEFPHAAPRDIILEKLPLFALAGLSALLTFIAQKHGDAITNPWHAPLALRLANAPIVVVTYLARVFYPADLAAFYPWPAVVPFWKTSLALLFLCAITAVAILQRRQRPWLATGWLWYLVTLVPVLGLLQPGLQSMADRSTYLPLIGIFICVAWSLGELAESRTAWRRPLAAGLAACLLAACLALAFFQIQTWNDSRTVFSRVIEKYGPGEVALNSVGMALLEEGKIDDAVDTLQKSMDINVDNPVTLTHLAVALFNRRDYAEASLYLKKAVALAPHHAPAHSTLAKVLTQMGDLPGAIEQFHAAIQSRDLYPDATEGLATALYLRGDYKGALASMLLALEQKPDSIEFKNNLAWLLATCPEPSLRNGPRAVILAKEAAATKLNSSILDTLAAAYAETDQFDKAVEAAKKAVELSRAKGKSDFTAVLENRLKLYEQGMPYQDDAPPGQEP